jgi:glycosyltransferase involved in cell wall biosynthesis
LIIERFENRAAGKFSTLVAATPEIGKRFEPINPRTVVINNYPLLNELHLSTPVPWQERTSSIAYVGVITEVRGIFQMMEAMQYVPTQLNATLELAGSYCSAELQEKVRKQPGWSHIHELGVLNRAEVAQLLSRVCGGLVTFLPAPNHLQAQPNKLFEYMSAGIPVIASDFSLWRSFIDKTGCGLVVNPLDTQALAHAITFLITQPAAAEEMGRKGRKAIEQYYNWETQVPKLVELYEKLLN